MKILIQTKRNQYRYFAFGFKTETHNSKYWFSSGIEYLKKYEINYATRNLKFLKNNICFKKIKLFFNMEFIKNRYKFTFDNKNIKYIIILIIIDIILHILVLS